MFNGPTLLGVAVLGNLVARAFAEHGFVEVNRLCARRDVPAPPQCSTAGVRGGGTPRRGKKMVTYTHADEPGTSLEAAGLMKGANVRGADGTATSADEAAAMRGSTRCDGARR